MPYPESLVAPMRAEMVQMGAAELRTVADVDAAIGSSTGTTLVFVNSVCGCAAGKARPGVMLSLQSDVKPQNLITVFAGADVEATNKAREYFVGYPPSSPSIALLREGKLLFMMERHDIEGQDAMAIANRLNAAFQEHCGVAARS